MIEHIQGAGLSGMTGKSTKHGKNSLFAKLLAMLEKNAEISGKGKGLQLNAGKTDKADKAGKAKGLASLTEKSDPFTVAKSKHLLALAAKGKADGKDKMEDGSAASLLAAHVIVDPKSYVKETNTTGKMSVLIAGKLAEKTADQGGELAAKDAAKSGAGLAAGVEAGVLNKGSDKADVLLNKMAQAGAGKEADALAAQQKGQPAQQTQAMLGESSAADEPVLATVSKHALAAGKEANGPQASGAGLAGDVATNAAQATGSKVELDAVARSVLDGQKTVANLQGNHSLGEKKVVKTPTESINAAAALFQQAKASQPQQVQQPVAASVMAAAQSSVVDASLADSGSQFSDDRGGQDARLLNAGVLDVKSTGSSASASFQNYLTSKSVPVLSPFDSMNHIAQSAKNGQTRLDIQLDPANLGKIQISIQSDASKHLQVHMIVDQGMTRAVLEQQLPQLRSALAQQGFDLSGFSMDSQGQQQASAGGSDGGGRKSPSFNQDAELLAQDISIAAPQKITGSGLSIRV